MEILHELGLTQREIKVYSALLELGSTTTGSVIKKSEVPNSKIYEILESLQNKGLVSWIVKGKTKYFQASDPRQLLSLLKDKERRLKDIIPKLEARQKLSQSKRSVELFEGVKSIRSMFLGLFQDIKKGECCYGFSTGETSKSKEIEEFYEWLGILEIEIGVKYNLLISSSNKEEFKSALTEDAKKSLKRSEWALRFSEIPFPGDTAIFRDHVIIINWDDVPTATLMTNENLANQYRDFFLDAWKKAKS